eukprot:770086-Pyramimonas_sp.AAC.1
MLTPAGRARAGGRMRCAWGRRGAGRARCKAFGSNARRRWRHPKPGQKPGKIEEMDPNSEPSAD